MMKSKRSGAFPQRFAVTLLLFMLGSVSSLQAQGTPIPSTNYGQRSKAIIPSSVFVEIRDAATQAPIPGALASIVLDPEAEPVTAISGSDGLLFFPVLAAGDYIITFSAAGYEDFVIPIMVLPGEFIVIIATEFISMIPKSSGSGPLMNLYLTVKDEAGNALSDPDIEADPSLGVAPIEVTAGVFAYLAVPIVEYDIRVRADGYVDKLVPINNPDLFVEEEVVMRRAVPPLPGIDCAGGGAGGGARRVRADLLVVGGLFLLLGSWCVRRPRSA
jgi:hypothetical protein